MPEDQFSADIPKEIRDRMSTEEELREVTEALGSRNPQLRYAQPQNCTLHFLSPTREVKPSFFTVIGMTVCPQCCIRVGIIVDEMGLSAAEFIRLAQSGAWLGSDGTDSDSEEAKV